MNLEFNSQSECVVCRYRYWVFLFSCKNVNVNVYEAMLENYAITQMLDMQCHVLFQQ